MTAKKLTEGKITKAKARPRKTELRSFMRLAGSQMRRCCIPTAIAITTSVVLSKIGAPLVPIALVGAGGWAWWKGYRIRIVKPGKDNNHLH